MLPRKLPQLSLSFTFSLDDCRISKSGQLVSLCSLAFIAKYRNFRLLIETVVHSFSRSRIFGIISSKKRSKQSDRMNKYKSLAHFIEALSPFKSTPKK